MRIKLPIYLSIIILMNFGADLACGRPQCSDPEACFTVWPATDDRYVCIDDAVTFSAACTTDPDGCGLIWTWGFGKDAYDKSDGNSDWEYCKYSTPGDRQVTLRVAERPSEYNPCCSGADTFARTVTVVEVASLLPDEGVEIDDGDGDPDTKSFVICIADSGVVTVTATPDPNISEEKLPGYGYSWGWELTGGDGDSLLFRTVDKTTPAKTVITCSCGEASMKKTTIYVYEAKLNLYAKGGLSYIPLLVTLGDFGHSWWKLEFSHPEVLQPTVLRYYLDTEIGYWPAEGFPIYNPMAFVPGYTLVYDQGCTGWAMGEWTLTWTELRAALYYSKILHNSPGDFSAWFHNCTDEAVTAGETAGVETIDASSNPTLPLTLFLYLLIH